MNITWTIKAFDFLSTTELYHIMWLRNEVFVVEQNCVFQDADFKDFKCYHLMGWSDDHQLMAYCRLVPKGLAFDEISIGRVITNPVARKTGAGRLLMEKAIQQCDEIFGKQPIRIGAQYYLLRFYGALGFVPQGDIYLEDGIEHIEMILSK